MGKKLNTFGAIAFIATMAAAGVWAVSSIASNYRSQNRQAREILRTYEQAMNSNDVRGVANVRARAFELRGRNRYDPRDAIASMNQTLYEAISNVATNGDYRVPEKLKRKLD